MKPTRHWGSVTWADGRHKPPRPAVREGGTHSLSAPARAAGHRSRSSPGHGDHTSVQIHRDHVDRFAGAILAPLRSLSCAYKDSLSDFVSQLWIFFGRCDSDLLEGRRWRAARR